MSLTHKLHRKSQRYLKFSAWNVNTGCYFVTCTLPFRIKPNKKLFQR